MCCSNLFIKSSWPPEHGKFGRADDQEAYFAGRVLRPMTQSYVQTQKCKLGKDVLIY